MFAVDARRRAFHFIAAAAALALAAALAVADSGPAHAVGARVISGHISLPADASDTSYFDNLQVIVSGVTTLGSGYDDSVGTDGAFSIGSLAADTYTLQVFVNDDVVGSDYVPIPIAQQYYPSAFVVSGATPIDVTTTDVTNIAMTLTAAGKVAGTVTIADGLTQDWITSVFVRVTRTDGFKKETGYLTAGGSYSIANLPPGTYTVRFMPGPYGPGNDTTSLRPQYYDATEVATPVTVTANATTTGINAVMSNIAYFASAPTPVITHLGLNVGSSLGLSSGAWSPSAVLTAQWNRNGVPIALDGTDAGYTLVPDDRGTTLTVTVTGTQTGYYTTSKTSAGIYIPLVFTTTKTPTITGIASSGHTLTAHRGTWSPTATYTYQWYRNSTKISGATKYTYKLVAADKGRHITVKVTGKRTGYTTVVKTSAIKNIAR